MHTILGAGGPVANALTKELINHNETIRLVSRRPVNTNKAIKLPGKKPTCLTTMKCWKPPKAQLVIYLCAGLVYDKDIWREQWPVIIRKM
jgi:NAD dependent epimerase/dehydratase family enzyme